MIYSLLGYSFGFYILIYMASDYIKAKHNERILKSYDYVTELKKIDKDNKAIDDLTNKIDKLERL